MTQALIALLDAIRSLYTEAPTNEDIADVLNATIHPGAPQTCAPDPSGISALAWLPRDDGGRFGKICAYAQSAAADMPWHYSYAAGDGRIGRIAFADLVGPAGPFVCDRLRLGLTLVAPQTLYPMHAHPARELYCIVAGVAVWTAGAISRRPGPGEFVLHPSGIAHAMQTDDQALLAIYSWRGDIMTPPYYTDDE